MQLHQQTIQCRWALSSLVKKSDVHERDDYMRHKTVGGNERREMSQVKQFASGREWKDGERWPGGGFCGAKPPADSVHYVYGSDLSFQKLSNKIWHTVSPFNLFTSFVFIVILRVSIALSELEADTTWFQSKHHFNDYFYKT